MGLLSGWLALMMALARLGWSVASPARQSRTISAQATLPITRVKTTEDSVEVGEACRSEKQNARLHKRDPRRPAAVFIYDRGPHAAALAHYPWRPAFAHAGRHG
jgi:hypothetical protein